MCATSAGGPLKTNPTTNLFGMTEEKYIPLGPLTLGIGMGHGFSLRAKMTPFPGIGLSLKGLFLLLYRPPK